MQAAADHVFRALADPPRRLVKPRNLAISLHLDDLVGTVAVTQEY